MTRIAVVVVLGLALTGCKDKVQQCNAFINEGNKAQEALGSGDDVKPETFKTAAGQIDESVKRLEGLKLDDQKLGEFRGRYVDGLKTYSKALVQLSEVAKDPSKAAEAEKIGKEVDAVGDKEKKLIDEINTYCQPK